jgi:queuine tRNA-ribosyltransferase
VTFTSHLDGSVQRLTPERAMEIQALLGSDVAMAFDQLVDPGLPAVQVAEAMERTHRWAERSLAARGRPDQAVFGIVQGGVDAELRRASVAAIASQAFDGIAIGGLSVGESKAAMAATLDVLGDALGDDPRPRYLMGVGSPVDFATAIERGIDLFDCVLPTRVARTGQVWTDAGRLNLRNAALQDDPGPIDPGCACEACRNHSRAYLAHLFRAREMLGPRLASVHNVSWTLALLARLRTGLGDGSFGAVRDAVAIAFGRVYDAV